MCQYMSVELKKGHQMSIFITLGITQRSLTEPEIHCWQTSSHDLPVTLLTLPLRWAPALCLAFMWILRIWTQPLFPKSTVFSSYDLHIQVSIPVSSYILSSCSFNP